MNSEDSSTDSTELELPVVAEGEGLPPHPEPSFEQMLAHARLLLSWQSPEMLEKRRARMNPERFVM
jgi:hypothetical protein